MQKVKIVSGEKRDTLKTLTKILTVCLVVLTTLIIFFAHDNPSLTGYSVFSGSYGAASPYLIVFLLLVIITMYVQLHRD